MKRMMACVTASAIAIKDLANRGAHPCRLVVHWWGWAGLLALLALGLMRDAQAEGYPGFGLDASRVVVMADAHGGTQVTALNNSDNVYLVQSQVFPADGVTGYPMTQGRGHAAATAPVPFLVTPPLKKLAAQSRLPLRILVTPKGGLPQDRESLFFLSAKAIPSVPPRTKVAGEAQRGPQIVLALQQYVKLFYRPVSLKPRAIFDGDVAPKLTVSRVGDRLRITNPTPYHITFWALTVAGKAVDKNTLRTMVPPKGTQDYPMPAGVKGGVVTWQIIDEFGLVTDLQKQTLS